MTDYIVTIRWDGAIFNMTRDHAKDWHLKCTKGDHESLSYGPDAAEVISEACESVGFDEETKWEILFALMHSLRERMFN